MPLQRSFHYTSPQRPDGRPLRLRGREETWYWDDSSKEIVRKFPDTAEYRRVGLAGKFDGTDPIVETDSGVYGPRAGYRELIAQSPRMARLLLRLLTQHFDENDDTRIGSVDRTEIESVLYEAGVHR
jgi:hypothetical protein